MRNPPVMGVREKDFKEVHDFVEDRVRLLKEGQYEYIIRLSSKYKNNPVFEKCYSFVLFESDIDQLVQKTTNYQKGQYIYFNGGTVFNSKSGVSTSLTGIDDIQTIKDLERALEN